VSTNGSCEEAPGLGSTGAADFAFRSAVPFDTLRLFVLVGPIMSISRVLLAAAGGGHDAPPLLDIDWTLAVQLAIFLGLYFVLKQAVFAPFLQMRKQRQDSIVGARARAEAMEKSRQERDAEYQRGLAAARQQASAQRATERAAAKDEAQQLLVSAREQCDAKLIDARERIAQSLPAAELAMRTRADQLAKSIASKVLGRQL
jgi:F-type H+-transporting ATPase subunit b